ncbi:MAG: hypothetical protein AAFU03_06640 [Bacteroidota bacterium]
MSCARRGSYTITGSYENVQLLFSGKKVGILDPRGAFGDADALREVELQLKKLIKCPGTEVLTEDQLSATGWLPAIYSENLEKSHLQYFTEKTDLDYLIHIVTGPGRLASQTGLSAGFGADREAHAHLIVYDLHNKTEAKTITVNGTLNQDVDKKWYETEYSEPDLGRRAIRKGLELLIKYSDCS